MEEQREQCELEQQQQTSLRTTTAYVNQSSAAAAAPVVSQSQSHSHNNNNNNDDDAWWWEVENGDFILDLVPNTDMAQSESENTSNSNNNNNNTNNAISSSANFVTLLKHGENTTATTSRSVCNADDMITENHDQPADNKQELFFEKHSKLSGVTLLNQSHSDSNTFDDSHDSNALHQTIHNNNTTNVAVVVREQTLEEFKEELRMKRLARQTAVQDLRDEISTLRRQLAEEQELTRHLRRNNAVEEEELSSPTKIVNDEDGAIGGVAVANIEPDSDDEDPQSRGRHANIELANAQLALQMANAENLSLRTELGVVHKQVGTLKEVIACCKQMLSVKEEQCMQLKSKLEEIETAFSEREMKIMSSNLRQEYERQLGNIRQLRQLYEERQRIALAEQENLQRLISIKRDELAAEQQKTKNIEEHNQTLMKEIESANNELATLREECNEHKFEKKTLKEEMGAVNTLFSQMVMGFNGEDNLDIDRLTMMLEENRGLLNDMATKEANCTDGATLPKLLFELVEQAAISSKTIAEGRSPTPTSSDEYGEEYTRNRDSPDRADNTNGASVATKQYFGGDEATSASVSASMAISCTTATETDNLVMDHNNGNCKTIKVTNPHCRKHNRKSTGNRMKLPATIADDTAATSSSPSSSPLKIHEAEVMSKVATTQEIIGNLPKVWKVLMELLSHHKIERVQFEEHGASEDCYKSIETANGPKAELSVSKTYIKLKDLILEKKSLVKETNRLKTLNCHLEYRLNEQEKRLSAVSLELTKTWHLVGKMQRQHRQLHTQEQILRYQLQQKRRLLSELKDELEYCRRKWAAARAKNDESQEQCNDLRREFALRKLEHANNSAESGYSDSGQVSDEDIAIGVTKDDNVVVVANGIEMLNTTNSVHSNNGGSGVGVNGAGCVGGVGGAGAACRRKRLKEMFEHTRKIKRMQSTSPGRAGDNNTNAEIVLRWNSAPPTCGWRHSNIVDDIYNDEIEDNNANGVTVNDTVDLTGATTSSGGRAGAIPKSYSSTKHGRHRSRKATMEEQLGMNMNVVDDVGVGDGVGDGIRGERAERIQRLEEQCKSLIQQVLETSDNREKLEVQLRSFQDEISPVQHAVPLNDIIKRKRLERMTRASSVPVTGTLTPREEEYTRKRSERLERLEEESRQLLSRIKRTSDRGHYLRCSLDRLRRAPSREGSFESNTEEESSRSEEKDKATSDFPKPKLSLQECVQVEEVADPMLHSHKETLTSEAVNISPLTTNEEAYTARRSARLQRLENESRELLTRLSRNNERGEQLGNKLDALHEQHYDEPTTTAESSAPIPSTNLRAIASEPILPVVSSIEERLENIEQISSNRMERLRILEEEGKELLNRLAGTSARGTQMINRIAEREQNRQIVKASGNNGASSNTTNPLRNATRDGNAEADDCASGIESSAVTSLMPRLNNVACSSIVTEELTDHITVTTIPSQIGIQKGAIPKQKLVLNAAKRAEAAQNRESKQNSDTNGESIEDMVRRLRETPYPNVEEQNTGAYNETAAEKETIDSSKEGEKKEAQSQQEQEQAQEQEEVQKSHQKQEPQHEQHQEQEQEQDQIQEQGQDQNHEQKERQEKGEEEEEKDVKQKQEQEQEEKQE